MPARLPPRVSAARLPHNVAPCSPRRKVRAPARLPMRSREHVTRLLGDDSSSHFVVIGVHGRAAATGLRVLHQVYEPSVSLPLEPTDWPVEVDGGPGVSHARLAGSESGSDVESSAWTCSESGSDAESSAWTCTIIFT